MKTAFDFSKVKKAAGAKSKSLNDLYASGIPGQTDPSMQYGDNTGETKIKNTVEKYKNNNTKKRILRQYYGDSDVIDKSELEDIKKLREYKPGIDQPTEYTTDYFNDFYNRAIQSQSPNSAKLEREYGESYLPTEGFRTAIGQMPTEKEKRMGIGGTVNLPLIDKWRSTRMNDPDAIQVHSHPDHPSMTSVDKERNSLLGDRRLYFGSPSYMVSAKGNVIKFNRDPAQDIYSTDIINKLNKLYHKSK